MDSKEPSEPLEPWTKLRQKFMACVATKCHWADTWQMFLADPCYRAELKERSCQVLGKRAPRAWAKDIEHEAMLILAAKLSKSPDLHVDPDRVDAKFPAWMGSIITNACRSARKRLLRLHAREIPLEESALLIESPASQLFVDLSLAIEEMHDPTRSIFALYQQRYPLTKIAELMGLTYWETHYALHRGLDMLRDQLKDD